MKNTIHIGRGMVVNMDLVIHYMDVMVIRATPAVDPQYIQIGLIGIESNH